MSLYKLGKAFTKQPDINLNDRLIFHHNTDAQRLLIQDQQGGLDAPSLDFLRTNRNPEGVGDITLIRKPEVYEPIETNLGDMVDPAQYIQQPKTTFSFDDFSGALIPRNTDQATRDILNKHKIPYEEYFDEADRVIKKDTGLGAKLGTPLTMAGLVGYSTFKSEEADAIPIYKSGKIIIEAYHGTPHKVKKFSSKKIGTGEGAQAYGHGLYFADRKGVAQHYQEDLTEVKIINNNYDGKGMKRNVGKTTFKMNLSEVARQTYKTKYPNMLPKELLESTKKSDSLADQVYTLVTGGLRDKPMTKSDINNKIKFFKKNKNELVDYTPDEVDITIAILEHAKQYDISVKKGNLYKVELEASPDEFLDWDTQLKSQPKKIQDAVIRAYKKDRDKLIADNRFVEPIRKPANQLNNPNFTEIDALLEKSGQSVYYRSSGSANEQRIASENLLAEGIKGIRFHDGASRKKPLKQFIKEFRKVLPDDADIEEVMEMVHQGHFNREQTELLRALFEDDFLGFDYPAQAVSEALRGNPVSLAMFDPSQRLLDAIEACKPKDVTNNYVVFDDTLITIKTENDVPITPVGKLTRVN